MFPAAEVWVDFSWNSDHALLILQLSRPKHRQKRNRFRYEASWALENEYKDLIASAWGRHSGLVSGWDSIQQKLSRCKGYSIRWQQHRNGPMQTSIKTLQNRLNVLQGEEGDLEGRETKMVKKELQLLLDQEDLKWRQRAKIDWLKLGDRNTKIFHACANQLKKTNQIYKIKDEQGNFWESQGDIEKAFVNYFSGLFSTAGSGNLEQCFAHLRIELQMQ